MKTNNTKKKLLFKNFDNFEEKIDFFDSKGKIHLINAEFI